MSWSKRSASQTFGGFTLTELLVVVAILGMLASGSMLVLSGYVRRAESLTSWEAIKNLVTWARIRSQTEPVSMTIDLDRQVIQVMATDSGSSREHRIKGQVRILEGIVDGEPVHVGKMVIDFSEGYGKTFAVRIQVQPGSTGKQRWLILCGLSGEFYEYDHESQMAAALQKWLAASNQSY